MILNGAASQCAVEGYCYDPKCAVCTRSWRCVAAERGSAVFALAAIAWVKRRSELPGVA